MRCVEHSGLTVGVARTLLQCHRKTQVQQVKQSGAAGDSLTGTVRRLTLQAALVDIEDENCILLVVWRSGDGDKVDAVSVALSIGDVMTEMCSIN